MNNQQLKSLISGLLLNEYVDFVESRALHLGVSPFELNIQFWEQDLVSMARFELAKAQLLVRRACDSLERDWPERG
jgi:hypothetical protein